MEKHATGPHLLVSVLLKIISNYLCFSRLLIFETEKHFDSI